MGFNGTHLAAVLFGGAIVHALHLKAGQIRGVAKTLHVSQGVVQAADTLVEGAAQTALAQAAGGGTSDAPPSAPGA